MLKTASTKGSELSQPLVAAFAAPFDGMGWHGRSRPEPRGTNDTVKGRIGGKLLYRPF